jgi:hypothetical protein
MLLALIVAYWLYYGYCFMRVTVCMLSEAGRLWGVSGFFAVHVPQVVRPPPTRRNIQVCCTTLQKLTASEDRNNQRREQREREQHLRPRVGILSVPARWSQV